MIAPTIGSMLLAVHSWQMIFYVLSSYSIVILVLAFKFLPEALRNNTSEEKEISFLSRYKVVFSNGEARLDIVSSMMISFAFFAYLTAIPFVYLTVFQVSEFSFSVLFGITVIALMSSHFINTRLIVRKGSRKMLAYGLICALFASTSLLVVNYLSLPLTYTVLSILPLMGGISMVSVNSDALVIIKFPDNSGTATAVLGTLRFGIGALAGPVLAYFYNGSALPFAILMFAAVLVVLVCQIIIYNNDKK